MNHGTHPFRDIYAWQSIGRDNPSLYGPQKATFCSSPRPQDGSAPVQPSPAKNPVREDAEAQPEPTSFTMATPSSRLRDAIDILAPPPWVSAFFSCTTGIMAHCGLCQGSPLTLSEHGSPPARLFTLETPRKRRRRIPSVTELESPTLRYSSREQYL